MLKPELKDDLLKYISGLEAYKRSRSTSLAFKEGCRWNNMTGDLHDIISKESRKLSKHIQYTVESKMPIQ